MVYNENELIYFIQPRRIPFRLLTGLFCAVFFLIMVFSTNIAINLMIFGIDAFSFSYIFGDIVLLSIYMICGIIIFILGSLGKSYSFYNKDNEYLIDIIKFGPFKKTITVPLSKLEYLTYENVIGVSGQSGKTVWNVYKLIAVMKTKSGRSIESKRLYTTKDGHKVGHLIDELTKISGVSFR